MNKAKKRRFSVTLTGPFLEGIDHLVKKGFYIDPQAAMRDALRRLFEFHGLDPFEGKCARGESKKGE